MTASPRKCAVIVWLTFAALFVLHHDCWNWDSRSLVLGWLPVGLAWHAGFSLAAALLWAAATRWAWPNDIEQWAEETDTPAIQEESP